MDNEKKMEFEDCGYVRLSREFARKCKPYTGDSRGPSGAEYQKGEEGITFVKRILSKYSENILIGADEAFICIPKCQYEILRCLVK